MAIVRNDAGPGVDLVNKLNSHETVVAPMKRVLRRIRYELRDYETQAFAKLAGEITRVGDDFAADAKRF